MAQLGRSESWVCSACTFRNESGMALACSVCGCERASVAAAEAIDVDDDNMATFAASGGAGRAVHDDDAIVVVDDDDTTGGSAPIPCEACGRAVRAAEYDAHVMRHAIDAAAGGGGGGSGSGGHPPRAGPPPPPRRACPAGHALVSSSSDAGGYAVGWECDVCHAGHGRGTRRLHCAACHFDACEPHCAAAAAGAGAGAAGGPPRHVPEARPPGRGFVPLLARCLRAREAPGREYALCSGDVEHFSQAGGRAADGSGWSCGYRNAQMVCSALMAQPRWAGRLFGGARSIPDLSSMQRWLEAAWAAGFDARGAAHFGGRIAGSTAWVGASDCCALLRYFGVPARLVDFVSPAAAAREAARAAAGGGGGRGACFACGEEGHWANACPLRLLSGGGGGGWGASGARKRARGEQQLGSVAWGGGGGGGSGGGGGAAAAAAAGAGEELHEPLLAWAWAYFNNSRGGALPALLQHDGHSRTLVGVDRVAAPGAVVRFAPRGQLTLEELSGAPRPEPPRDTRLLVLDPSAPSEALGAALARGKGWERLLVRGIGTLMRAEYQVMYIPVDAEPLSGAAYERAKILENENG